MRKVLAFALPASRRDGAEVSLLPELRQDGTAIANSPRVDRYRRFLKNQRRGDGALVEIAARLGRSDGRLYRESEGKVPLSVDLLLEDALRLPIDQRARIATDLCQQMGLEAPLFRVDGLEDV